MKFKITLLYIVFAGFLLSSCSKSDESIEPIGVQNNQNISWVNYTHTINVNDAEIPYTIQYLSASGVHTIAHHTGNFSVHVPVMQNKKNGELYAQTMVSILPATNNGEELTPLHSQLTISTDNGLIIAQAGQTTYDCGYDQRTLREEKPLSWFNYKF
jgi:hypothetical protein